MTLELLDPWLLGLALLIIPFMGWRFVAHARRESRVRFSTVGLAAQLPRSLRVTLRPVLDVLRLAALLLAVLALARPAAVHVAEAAAPAGIDIVLAVDCSGSMLQPDMGGRSRLEAAQDVIQEFIAARRGDRIGLVAFAGEGVAVSPLTQDYPVLLGLLSGINPERVPQGTAIGNGLAAAINLVREGQGKSRVAILLTDGQNTGGDITPAQATLLAQALDVRIYTIGVGSVTGTPLPEGPRRFRGGIDEQTLQRIAAATGGAYFRATDEAALGDIYRTIDALEKNAVGTVRTIQVQELAGIALLAASLVLMLELLLANTLFRRAP